jgi:prefoldin, archaeal alpha subunit/eukaryotic subunit 5
MENENTLEDLIATADILKKHMENLSVQIAYLKEQIEEHNRARVTLENYLKLEEKELLVNIGADTYIYLNPSEKKRAMIPLGSGVIIESSIDRALEMIRSRIKDMEDLHLKLSQESEKVQAQYLAIESKVEEIYNKYQGRSNVQNP